MQFEILFGDPDTGEKRLIKVTLTRDEVQMANAHACPELVRQAIALRHAYAKVPIDFQHYSDRIKQVALQ
jgi:hypothetical protein